MRFRLAAAAGLVLAVTVPALAGPPAEGVRGDIAEPVVVCDGAAELESIVRASVRAPGQAERLYRELNALPNRLAEPTCAITAVPGATIGRVAAIGTFYGEGLAFRAHAVEVRTSAGAGWFLFLDEPARYLRV